MDEYTNSSSIEAEKSKIENQNQIKLVESTPFPQYTNGTMENQQSQPVVKARTTSFRKFVPQSAYKKNVEDLAWFVYEDDANPDIELDLQIRYMDDEVSGLVNRFTTGGKVGKKSDPAKIGEAYARYVLVNFARVTDDEGEALPNTLENRRMILRNSNILVFVINQAGDASGYVDPGEPEDQKK